MHGGASVTCDSADLGLVMRKYIFFFKHLVLLTFRGLDIKEARIDELKRTPLKGWFVKAPPLAASEDPWELKHKHEHFICKLENVDTWKSRTLQTQRVQEGVRRASYINCLQTQSFAPSRSSSLIWRTVGRTTAHSGSQICGRVDRRRRTSQSGSWHAVLCVVDIRLWWKVTCLTILKKQQKKRKNKRNLN